MGGFLRMLVWIISVRSRIDWILTRVRQRPTSSSGITEDAGDTRGGQPENEKHASAVPTLTPTRPPRSVKELSLEWHHARRS